MRRAATDPSFPALLFLTSTLSFGQTGTLDQDNTAIANVGVNMAFAPFVYEQVVVVGLGGELEGFVVRSSGQNAVTPNLPVAVYEWDNVALVKGARLWSGGVPANNLPYFTDTFVDTSAADLFFDVGDALLIQVGDGVADLTGWGLQLNQGWDQASSSFIALYPHDLYADGVYEPFDRLVFQTWMTESDLGTEYCTSNPNSTGAISDLRAIGSPTVAVNDLTLTVSSMPVGAFAIFLAGQVQGFTANPAGSEGNLCLGGAIGRFVGPGQIQQSDAAGTIALAIDLGQMPTPTGLVQVQPGESWNFQAWHRDAVGGAATSNFSSAREVVFQ